MSIPVSIVLRARNDIAFIARTLDGIASQSVPSRIFALDNNSTDGTREVLASRVYRLTDVPEGAYIPGRVLNQGMQISESDRVVFLNSDCIPQNEHWLAELLAAFSSADCAAVFGRQIPRPNCQPIFYKDTEDTFGDGSRQKYWKHCFSMASSAISREVWQKHPFREDIQYSEDIDWTWRMRQLGHSIRYAPASIVEHSHNYSPQQFYRRQYGEGKAEAQIFAWSNWERFWLRYSLLPFLRQVMSDYRYALKSRIFPIAYQSPVMRLAQMLGRRRGFLDGLKGRSAT